MASTPAPAPTDPRAALLAAFIDWLDEQGARVHVAGIYGCEPTSCNTPMPDLIAEFLAAPTGPGEADSTPENCNCGWGGTHDPDNPRCVANGATLPWMQEANDD